MALMPTRREFLRDAVAGGVAVALAGGGASGEELAQDAFPRRTLGRTGESVTTVGLGCAYAGSCDEAQTRVTIEAALDSGIRYFDGAPEYTNAEARLGPVLKPVRDEAFLVTKTYAFDAKQAEQDLHGSLERLRTDHVDLFLQHGVGLKPMWSAHEILGKGGSLEYLRKAKKEGLARYIGMSVHAPHKVALTLLGESDEWDVVMPFINCIARARELDDMTKDNIAEELLPRAQQSDIGIVGMKVLGGHPGELANDYDRAFRYALSQPGVACVLIGVRTVEEVQRAVRAAREFRPLTAGEMQETVRMGEDMYRAKTQAARVLERHCEGDCWGLERA